jgi:hypothetical protein
MNSIINFSLYCLPLFMLYDNQVDLEIAFGTFIVTFLALILQFELLGSTLFYLEAMFSLRVIFNIND